MLLVDTSNGFSGTGGGGGLASAGSYDTHSLLSTCPDLEGREIGMERADLVSRIRRMYGMLG